MPAGHGVCYYENKQKYEGEWRLGLRSVGPRLEGAGVNAHCCRRSGLRPAKRDLCTPAPSCDATHAWDLTVCCPRRTGWGKLELPDQASYYDGEWFKVRGPFHFSNRIGGGVPRCVCPLGRSLRLGSISLGVGITRAKGKGGHPAPVNQTRAPL